MSPLIARGAFVVAEVIGWESVTVREIDKLYSKAAHDQNTIFLWMADKFQSYSGIKQWLEEDEINVEIEKESWV